MYAASAPVPYQDLHLNLPPHTTSSLILNTKSNYYLHTSTPQAITTGFENESFTQFRGPPQGTTPPLSALLQQSCVVRPFDAPALTSLSGCSPTALASFFGILPGLVDKGSLEKGGGDPIFYYPYFAMSFQASV